MIDVGTKIGLLESALIETPDEFTQTLDKFVAKLVVTFPRLSKNEVAQLYGLKLINDLQFNTTPGYIRTQVRLKNGDTEYPPAMRFHLGTEENTEEEVEVQKFLVSLVTECKQGLVKKKPLFLN